MANTVTSFEIFTTTSLAFASQVMSNLANFRGDVIPINPSAASASTETHNWGASDRRWLTGYVNQLVFSGGTSTALAKIYADTSLTSGALIFNVFDTISAKILVDGLAAYSYAPRSFDDTFGCPFVSATVASSHNTTTFTTQGSVTIKTRGGPVMVRLILNHTGGSSMNGLFSDGGENDDNSENKIIFERDTTATIVYQTKVGCGSQTTTSGTWRGYMRVPGVVRFIDRPNGPTTVTYWFLTAANTTTGTHGFNNVRIIAYDM